MNFARALFQYFLRKAGLNVQQYIICEPSETLGEDKLKAMLATNDIVNFKVPSLSSGEDKILKEQELVFDGICLFIDDSFADEENKILSGLKAITKAVRQSSACSGRVYRRTPEPEFLKNKRYLQGDEGR